MEFAWRFLLLVLRRNLKIVEVQLPRAVALAVKLEKRDLFVGVFDRWPSHWIEIRVRPLLLALTGKVREDLKKDTERVVS